VEDEPEVANAIAAALASLENHFPLEIANSAEEAATLVDELEARAQPLGLVLCDHVLPGRQGVEFLVSLQDHPATASTRKVLLTGQAGLQATIQAVNQAGLHHYIAKPWNNRELVAVCKHQLTEYVIEKEENLMPYLPLLDTELLAEAMRQRQPGE
jgi:response regulator RpfG family c-di-GMP phosphodiesterase